MVLYLSVGSTFDTQRVESVQTVSNRRQRSRPGRRSFAVTLLLPFHPVTEPIIERMRERSSTHQVYLAFFLYGITEQTRKGTFLDVTMTIRSSLNLCWDVGLNTLISLLTASGIVAGLGEAFDREPIPIMGPRLSQLLP